MQNVFVPCALLAAALTLAACETEPPPPEDPIPTEQELVEPETYNYECPDGFRFQILVHDEAVELVLPDTVVMLPRLEAATGARYGTDGYEYWSRDGEALLETPDEERARCIPDRATPAW